MLEEIQGILPEEAVVVLGDKKEDKYRISAYYSYFQSLKQQFLNKQTDFIADLNAMPDPLLCRDNSRPINIQAHLLTTDALLYQKTHLMMIL
jgi:hypothetical protein